MPDTLDLILNALTGIRTQIVGYHQARTQSIVFLGGTAVAAAAFAFAHNDKSWAGWFAFVVPNLLLISALFLTVFFRQMLDWAQSYERKLLNEMRIASQSAQVASAPPGQSSGIYYSEQLKARTIDGTKITKKIWHDPPQNTLWVVFLGYLVFSAGWWKSHKASDADEKDRGIQVNSSTIVSVGGEVLKTLRMAPIMTSCPFASASFADPGPGCNDTGLKRTVSKIDCNDLATGLLLVVGGVDRMPLTNAAKKAVETNLQLAHARALTVKRALEEKVRECPLPHPTIVAVPRGPELSGIDDLDRTVTVYKSQAE